MGATVFSYISEAWFLGGGGVAREPAARLERELSVFTSIITLTGAAWLCLREEGIGMQCNARCK